MNAGAIPSATAPIGPSLPLPVQRGRVVPEGDAAAAVPPLTDRIEINAAQVEPAHKPYAVVPIPPAQRPLWSWLEIPSTDR